MNTYQELDMPSVVYLRWRRDLLDTLELHVTSSGEPYVPAAVADKMAEALKWYADADNHEMYVSGDDLAVCSSPIDMDEGEKAREVLTEYAKARQDGA